MMSNKKQLPPMLCRTCGEDVPRQARGRPRNTHPGECKEAYRLAGSGYRVALIRHRRKGVGAWGPARIKGKDRNGATTADLLAATDLLYQVPADRWCEHCMAAIPHDAHRKRKYCADGRCALDRKHQREREAYAKAEAKGQAGQGPFRRSEIGRIKVKRHFDGSVSGRPAHVRQYRELRKTQKLPSWGPVAVRQKAGAVAPGSVMQWFADMREVFAEEVVA